MENLITLNGFVFTHTSNYRQYPANTRHSVNVGIMLAHRLRRWPNIITTSAECFVLAGYIHVCILYHKVSGPAATNTISSEIQHQIFLFFYTSSFKSFRIHLYKEHLDKAL